MPTLTRDDDVFILDLGDGENRFNPDWVGAVDAALDEVEAVPAPRALVVSATGKVWSNGLDLDWMGQHQEQINDLLLAIHALYARVLGLGVPTMAAIQGHCFAAGAMLALALDARVMRADRGYFCLPEADIRIPFTDGMSALIQAKLTPQAAVASMTTGHRFGGEEAAAYGIVDAVAPLESLADAAAARVRGLAGKDRTTLGTIKSRMYAGVVAALLAPPRS